MYFYNVNLYSVKYFLLFSVLFLISCKKTPEKKEIDTSAIAEMRVVVQRPDLENVLPLFQPEIENWNEYKTLKSFLGRFKKASPKEVLSNSVELRDLVKAMKDSVKLEVLNNPSFETRVNIMYNESLRLADMNTIPAITANEVNAQIDKILEAFGAINAKINTIFSKKKFEDEITIDVSLIGLDTTKIDTISKNSILKKMDEKAKKLDEKAKKKENK